MWVLQCVKASSLDVSKNLGHESLTVCKKNGIPRLERNLRITSSFCIHENLWPYFRPGELANHLVETISFYCACVMHIPLNKMNSYSQIWNRFELHCKWYKNVSRLTVWGELAAMVTLSAAPPDWAGPREHYSHLAVLHWDGVSEERHTSAQFRILQTMTRFSK